METLSDSGGKRQGQGKVSSREGKALDEKQVEEEKEEEQGEEEEVEEEQEEEEEDGTGDGRKSKRR